MKAHEVIFDRVPMNATFAINGASFNKKSSRTAELAETGTGTFYFGKREWVEVSKSIFDAVMALEGGK